MTLLVETRDRGLIERIKERSKIFYQWMDIDQSNLPMSIRDTGSGIEIYITDGFVEYVTEFFTAWMTQIVNDDSIDTAEYVSKEFRKGCEEFLMSDIILH